MKKDIETLIKNHSSYLKNLIGTSLSIEECENLIRNLVHGTIYVIENSNNEETTINDSDIAVVEVLHDSLLDQGIFGLNHISMKNSRKLTKKMHQQIESKKLKS